MRADVLPPAVTYGGAGTSVNAIAGAASLLGRSVLTQCLMNSWNQRFIASFGIRSICRRICSFIAAMTEAGTERR